MNRSRWWWPVWGFETRIPLTSTTACSKVPPRRPRSAWTPRAPRRWRPTPGSTASTSCRVWTGSRSISSRVIRTSRLPTVPGSSATREATTSAEPVNRGGPAGPASSHWAAGRTASTTVRSAEPGGCRCIEGAKYTTRSRPAWVEWRRAESRVARRYLASFLLWLAVVSMAAVAASQDPAARQALTLLHTSDLHGAVLAWDELRDARAAGSLSKVAAVVEAVRAEADRPVLVLDSGDTLQGTPLEEFTHVRWAEPSPTVAAMNRIGYGAMAVGNHEFNFGLEALRRGGAGGGVSVSVRQHSRRRHRRARVPALPGPRRRRGAVGVLGLTTPNIPHWEEPEHYPRADLRGDGRRGAVLGSARSAPPSARPGRRPGPHRLRARPMTTRRELRPPPRRGARRRRAAHRPHPPRHRAPPARRRRSCRSPRRGPGW